MWDPGIFGCIWGPQWTFFVTQVCVPISTGWINSYGYTSMAGISKNISVVTYTDIGAYVCAYVCLWGGGEVKQYHISGESQWEFSSYDQKTNLHSYLVQWFIQDPILGTFPIHPGHPRVEESEKMVMANTSSRESENFYHRSQECAWKSGRAYGMMVFISPKDWNNMVCSTLISSFPYHHRWH